MDGAATRRCSSLINIVRQRPSRAENNITYQVDGKNIYNILCSYYYKTLFRWKVVQMLLGELLSTFDLSNKKKLMYTLYKYIGAISYENRFLRITKIFLKICFNQNLRQFSVIAGQENQNDSCKKF